MTDTTDPQTAEPELTETQKAYNVAQYEIFQLAAYGHCTYTNGELLTEEGKRQQADYNDRIRKAREEVEATLLRLVAEHAETFRGGWSVPAAWLRSLADDPAEVSLLAVTPEELEQAGLVPVQPAPSAAVSPPPATDRAALREQVAEAIRAAACPGDACPLSEVSGRPEWFADAALSVLPPANQPTLSDADRQLLTFALDLAADQMASRGDEFDADDEDAMERLRRLAAGERDEQQTQQGGGAAPEEALDLSGGPVRCPLCPCPVTLHTPNGARAHFTTVHPEQRLVGDGPWPLLENREESECSGIETVPNRCACDCDGCKHHCGAHQPAAAPVAGQPPADTGEEVRNVCVCSHTKGEHIAVSGRLLCDSCDPDSTENLVCKGFDAL